MNALSSQISKHRNADPLTWPESNLMNKLAESEENIADFVPDTSNPSRRT